VWHAFTTIIREEGALALYRGVTPNVVCFRPLSLGGEPKRHRVGDLSESAQTYLSYLFSLQLGNGTAWGSYFFGYSYLKRKWREQDPEGRPLSHVQHLIAANTAGILTLLITNPFWLVKTRMCLRQEQGRPAYRSVPRALRLRFKNGQTPLSSSLCFHPSSRTILNFPDALGSILREEGVRGLYKVRSALSL
jgi:hypothetical protein